MLSFTLILPEHAINFIEGIGKVLSQIQNEKLTEILPYFGFFILGLALLFVFISYLLKKNNQKRSVIYKLSNLLDEVIEYMDNNVKEEKKRYEYFVDSIAEMEVAKKDNATQQK